MQSWSRICIYSIPLLFWAAIFTIKFYTRSLKLKRKDLRLFHCANIQLNTESNVNVFYFQHYGVVWRSRGRWPQEDRHNRVKFHSFWWISGEFFILMALIISLFLWNSNWEIFYRYRLCVICKWQCTVISKLLFLSNRSSKSYLYGGLINHY